MEVLKVKEEEEEDVRSVTMCVPSRTEASLKDRVLWGQRGEQKTSFQKQGRENSTN